MMMSYLFLILVNLSSWAICTNPSEGKIVSHLEKSELKENSGMDFSPKFEGIFWTHNDANNEAKLFAYDIGGKKKGEYLVQNSQNIDWEDISVGSCLHHVERSCIYLGDIGNNKLERTELTIYVIEEPLSLGIKSLKVHSEIQFKIDRPFNFESLAFDEVTRSFLLISKSNKKDSIPNSSRVFTLADGANRASELALIDFNFFSGLSKEDMTITSADFDSKTNSLLLGSYGQSYQIQLKDLLKFREKAMIIPMPKLDKSESIAYFQDNLGNKFIYSTSEGEEQPLVEISCD